jgi:hypothetical protein
MELLNKAESQIRLWTAAHCIRRLTITSMTLAVRNKASAAGGFLKWELKHAILDKAKIMQDAYALFGNTDYNAERIRLRRAWDRRQMTFVGDQTILNPRVSCENLRWSQQADGRHSLCFSIFDLMSIDVTLPERDSTKTQALLESLSRFQKNASTEAKLSEKRSTFLRRIDVASQSEWIIHEGNMIRTWMNGFSAASIPTFADIIVVIEDLNRNIFSLPHPEESSFMTPIPVTTQDAVPPAQNQTIQVVHQGKYLSPRTTALVNKDIDAVGVTCYRQLRRYNASTGKVETIAQLELRPHEFCAGGAKQQPDHFWNRDRPWAAMMGDLTLGAAQDFAAAVKSSVIGSSPLSEQMDRFTVVSNFDNEDLLMFEASESSVVSPFLRHLMLPIRFLTQDLSGFGNFEKSGAMLLSMARNDIKARFQKGDSGAILLLDGIPIATLYSVDGEETSGGASILPLPDAPDDNSEPVPSRSSTRDIHKGTLSSKTCTN